MAGVLGFIYTQFHQQEVMEIERTFSTTNLPLATGHCDVDEAAGVYDALLRAALGGLLLLLGLDLCWEYVLAV